MYRSCFNHDETIKHHKRQVDMNMTIKQMLSLLLMLMAIVGLLSVLPEKQTTSLGKDLRSLNQQMASYTK
ncbi:MAG: hypothetical protein OEZ33_08235 [Gammaproteobacteria bacterium]|nr:hypothetical protein [Gammaproteobacteria bacterium]MDH5778185.1 hypothetical protein [Gammaproteobacteria bacterium]